MQGSRPWMHNGMNRMAVPLRPASWSLSTVALSFSCSLWRSISMLSSRTNRYNFRTIVDAD